MSKAKAMGVSAEAIKDLNEEATVYNIVHNSSISGSISGQNYRYQPQIANVAQDGFYQYLRVS